MTLCDEAVFKCRLFYVKFLIVPQIHENVSYRQESGQLEPLLTVHDVVLSYNNIEANRGEVNVFDSNKDDILKY